MEKEGHGLFLSLLILASFSKIRVPWSGMRNLRIPLYGAGFGFLHLLKAIYMRDRSEQMNRGSFWGLAPH